MNYYFSFLQLAITLERNNRSTDMFSIQDVPLQRNSIYLISTRAIEQEQHFKGSLEIGEFSTGERFTKISLDSKQFLCFSALAVNGSFNRLPLVRHGRVAGFQAVSPEL